MTLLAIVRRCLLGLTALTPAWVGAQTDAAAYPTRPITFIVPYAAGGVADATARLIGQKLQESWHQPVLIENRVGGGGLVGIGAAARAPADGYSVLLGVSSLVLQPQLVDKPTFDPFRDFAPITMIARLPLLLAVPRNGPSDLKAFVAQARAEPGRFSIGNYGVGSPSHLLSIMFDTQSGLDLPLVPFQGSSPLATALLGNQVSGGFIDSVTARQFADKLRFLAVTGARRVKGLPDLPTFAELGYTAFEQDGWLALLVPAATPPAIASRMAAEVSRLIATPEVAARIEAMGITPVGSTPADFAKVMRSDSEIYGKVIRQANIRIN